MVWSEYTSSQCKTNKVEAKQISKSGWGATIFTSSKNTAAVFLAKSVKKWVCFCQFQYEVYN